MPRRASCITKQANGKHDLLLSWDGQTFSDLAVVGLGMGKHSQTLLLQALGWANILRPQDARRRSENGAAPGTAMLTPTNCPQRSSKRERHGFCQAELDLDQTSCCGPIWGRCGIGCNGWAQSGTNATLGLVFGEPLVPPPARKGGKSCVLCTCLKQCMPMLRIVSRQQVFAQGPL